MKSSEAGPKAGRASAAAEESASGVVWAEAKLPATATATRRRARTTAAGRAISESLLRRDGGSLVGLGLEISG